MKMDLNEQNDSNTTTTNSIKSGEDDDEQTNEQQQTKYDDNNGQMQNKKRMKINDNENDSDYEDSNSDVDDNDNNKNENDITSNIRIQTSLAKALDLITDDHNDQSKMKMKNGQNHLIVEDEIDDNGEVNDKTNKNAKCQQHNDENNQSNDHSDTNEHDKLFKKKHPKATTYLPSSSSVLYVPNKTTTITTVTTSTVKRQSTNLIIMIDDLFVRKLLHKICPQCFDQNWLDRFKPQYFKSFLENELTEIKTNNQKKEISGHLEKNLSTNELTETDEIFVFWEITSLRNGEQIENQININDNEEILLGKSWIQQRDPMTYLYHFCELLMFAEKKFTHTENKELCRQLAREIRAYLYWITKDERFKEDSIEQEQLTTAVTLSKTAATAADDKAADLATNGQQHLFYLIVQHLLRIIFEMILLSANENGQNINKNKSISADENYIDNEDKNNNHKIELDKYLKVYLNCLFSLLDEDFDEKVTNSSKKFIKNDGLDEIESKSPESMYLFWMKNLQTIVVQLMKYYELNASSSSLPTADGHTNNNNFIHSPTTLNVEQQQLWFEQNGRHYRKNSISTMVTTSTDAANDINSKNDINNNIDNDNAGKSYFNNSQNYSKHRNLSETILPHASPSQQDYCKASSSDILDSHNTLNYSHLKTNMDATSNSESVRLSPFLSLSNGTASFNGCSYTNTTSSTQVERNSSSASSGPSSGVGSLDSSSHPSSSTPYRDIFNSNGGKFLFSSTTSPGNFTANSNTTNDDSSLSILLQMNNRHLDDLVVDDLDNVPKLIVPPSSSTQSIQSNNHSSAGNNITQDYSANNQFGFDFNSLNNTRNNDNETTPAKTFNSNDFFSNSGVIENNGNGIGNGSSSATGNFFNEFNMSSLFSSFDDNVSSTAESGTLTDFTTNAANGGNLVNASPVIVKHYPQDDSIIQLPNQCFTMTLNEQTQPTGTLLPQSKFSQTKPMLNTHKYGLSNVGQNHVQMPEQIMAAPPLVKSQPSTNLNSSLDELCERQTLYRLIISQLLFDGHRTIACQVAVTEHIKCDSFLIGPSQELHKLVTFAKAKKKEDILMDKSAEQVTSETSFHPKYARAGSSFFEINGSSQNSPALMHQNAPHPLRMDDAMFEQNSHFSNNNSMAAMFANNNGNNLTSASATPHTPQSFQSSPLMDYADMISPSTELFNSSNGPIDYYYSMNKSPEVQNIGGNMFTKNELARQQLAVGNRTNGSMKCLTSLESNNSANSSGNELVLTETCLKNINQLAKLNSIDVKSSIQNQASLLGTGPVNNNNPIMFGRSSSAMAMTNGSESNISRSPLNFKSPIGHPATHTTGNGKNHQIMQILYKFGSLGQLKSQFSSPHGFCLGINDEIIIADTNNHRICVYDKNGIFKQMFGNPGKDEGQLWYPRKITMVPPNFVRNTVNSPYYVICDRGMERSRMQIFTRNGNFVRKIPIRYIDIVAGIAINSRGHIVVVDSVSPTIYVIAIDNGTLIEWRDCGDYMREPSDVAIYDDDYYICDFKGHCVVVINSAGEFLRKIGMEGLTSFPNGIDISVTGDIFVGDSHGNKFHVVVFNREGRLLAEYECPYCKVSRCCGLKLTKENNIVTLAKNNHHVLVLNPNFQQPQSQQQQQLQLQTSQIVS